MYGYIKGIIEDIDGERVIIENNGIGYNVFVSSRVMASIGYTGREIKLYTYLSVKEDSMTLFGFLSKDELSLFKMLIMVSGIGPKGAMGILGALNPEDLRFAIMSGDVKAISQSPGIGAKTAQKVILELKDKIKPDDFIQIQSQHSEGVTQISNNDIIAEAAMALTSLGYGQTEALRAIKLCDTDSIGTVEELIKAALKKMI
ncbi:MAG: Holliday junction branch migration protein RuvA [Lachnospiraceae bacterium]